MKRILFFIFILFVLFTQVTQAQIGEGSVNVNATVQAPTPTEGEASPSATLSISGFASPNASIVATVNGNFLASTTGDAAGNFLISNVSLPTGNTTICFVTVDFKRIGESEGCLDTKVEQGKDISNVYLPPTIGLLKKQINTGQQTTVFGYSMPNSTITINIENGKAKEVNTDSTGYYEYKYQAVAAGKFNFISQGTYQNEPSLKPRRGVTLEALSPVQFVGEKAKEGFGLLQPILFILAILLLVGIIIFLIIFLGKRKKKERPTMHHDWLLEIEKKEHM